MSFGQSSQFSPLFSPRAKARRRDLAAGGDRQARGRVLCLEPLESRCLLSAATRLGNPNGAGSSQTLADLPVTAQSAILAAIGRDQVDYQATDGMDGMRLANPANGFMAQVPSGTLHVSAGSDLQEAKLTAFEGAANSYFGSSVAVSSDTVVVGAPNATVGRNSQQGAAYVFVKPSAGWSGNLIEIAELTASDGAAGDQFGSSIAISGNTVVVGADDTPGGGNQNQGSAYVFVEPSFGWTNMTQTAKLTTSSSVAYVQFGIGVAISGDTVVVAAWGNGNGYPAEAFVYVEPLLGWLENVTQTATLTAPGAGSTVAISGGTVVLGADNTQIPGRGAVGAAYVFVEPVLGWSGTVTDAATLTAFDGAAGDQFGDSVAISGNTVVVGADDAGAVGGIPGQGAAYVFVEPKAGWAGDLFDAAKLTASDGTFGDGFGFSVAFDGDTMVIGADRATVGTNSGQAQPTCSPHRLNSARRCSRRTR